MDQQAKRRKIMLPDDIEPDVHVTYPLSIGTATPADMVRLTESLRFEESDVLCNVFYMRLSAKTNRFYVVRNPQGAVLACAMPASWTDEHQQARPPKSFTSRDKLDIDWMPDLFWTHPAARDENLDCSLYHAMEKLAIKEGQSHFNIVALNHHKQFWRSLGFIPEPEMADVVNVIRRNLGFDEAILSIKPSISRYCKVLAVEKSSYFDDPIPPILEVTVRRSLQSQQLKELPTFNGQESLEVLVGLTLFTRYASVCKITRATFCNGMLEFENTLCLPLPNSDREEKVHIAAFIYNEDHAQLSVPTLVHFDELPPHQLQGALFVRKFLVSRRLVDMWSFYLGATVMLDKTAIPRGMPGIHHQTPSHFPHLQFLPKDIVWLIGEYTSQYLPPVHDPSQNIFEPWSAELQPIF